MRRREFIVLTAGAAAWPALGRAQPAERMRRIAVLMDLPENDDSQPRLAAFVQGLAAMGWSDGHNLRIDVRWGANNLERSQTLAAELLAINPDVVLSSATSATAAMQRASKTTPIVFALVADPVGAGLVESLARPGANITGFTLFEFSIAAKWLQLLKEIAPGIKRVAVLRDAGIAAGVAQYSVIQSAAPSFGVELRPLGLRDADEIERAISAFGRGSNGGIVVTASPLAGVHREQIISLAARYQLPSMFAYRHFVAAGGLLAYGPDLVDPYRRAAGYVSRILKGEKPAELPVQAATDYKLAINVRTAKALGLIIPPTLLARADEVIE